jgi:hypothetical protein
MVSEGDSARVVAANSGHNAIVRLLDAPHINTDFRDTATAEAVILIALVNGHADIVDIPLSSARDGNAMHCISGGLWRGREEHRTRRILKHIMTQMVIWNGT